MAGKIDLGKIIENEDTGESAIQKIVGLQCDFIKECNDAMDNDDCKKYYENCARYQSFKGTIYSSEK